MPFTILRPSIAGLGGQACIDAEFDDRPWSTDAPCARVRSYRTSARESVLVVNRRMHMGIPEGAVNVKRVLTERAIFFPDEGREQPVESSRTSTAWARRKKPPTTSPRGAMALARASPARPVGRAGAVRARRRGVTLGSAVPVGRRRAL